jgi:predicted alpha/beta-hydrolase family hydrolase
MHLQTLFLCTSLLLGTANACAQATIIKRADGTDISAIVNLPPGVGKVPAVVLAPGQGYHMTLPAMESTALALAEQGFAVFRFNWTYFTSEPRREPSPDLSAELQELQAVVAAARAHGRVDGLSVSVGGKSLGSVVAWLAFTMDPKLQSALLLTPVCSRVHQGDAAPRPEAKENYPGFESERRPSLWISGDTDPLCASTVMYAFAANGAKNTRVAIVGGDHSYEIKASSASEADALRARNLRAVSALAAGFMAETHRSPR